MSIETVNEIIASLESAGELSIKERKYLELAKAYADREEGSVALALTFEKCREIVGCPVGIDLQDHLRHLAAENVGLALDNLALKQIVDSVTDLSNEPQYHEEGMGCGLEDRGITDRYEACYYGWNEAMERVYGEVIPCADELDFPATDRIVAGIKADAQSEVIEWLDAEITAIDTMYRGDPSYERDANWMKSEVLDVVELARKAFPAQLREGAK